jgi:membrane protein YqaA with SNARE-associated domain
MTIELFISILVISSSATSIAAEIIKQMLNELNIKYKSMPVAVIIAFIVGASEMAIYAIANGITDHIIIYALCTGVANIIGATTTYDTVKALIYALFPQATAE